MNHQLILFFLVLLVLVHHDVHLLNLLLLADPGFHHLNWNYSRDVFVGLALEAGLFLKDGVGHVIDLGLGGDFP